MCLLNFKYCMKRLSILSAPFLTTISIWQEYISNILISIVVIFLQTKLNIAKPQCEVKLEFVIIHDDPILLIRLENLRRRQFHHTRDPALKIIWQNLQKDFSPQSKSVPSSILKNKRHVKIPKHFDLWPVNSPCYSYVRRWMTRWPAFCTPPCAGWPPLEDASRRVDSRDWIYFRKMPNE